MKFLNTSSLTETVDNVNNAYFYNEKISKDEALKIIDWIEGRYNTEFSYNESFGYTKADSKAKLKTFTGDVLNSPASARHIHAQEASRVLTILSKEEKKKKVSKLDLSNRSFQTIFEDCHKSGTPVGTYCCGPCTVSLWRHMAVGGLGDYSLNLDKGLSVLKKHRKESGEYRRFPFYYTLSALLDSFEMSNAKKELKYLLPRVEQRLKTVRTGDVYGIRKKEILERTLNLPFR